MVAQRDPLFFDVAAIGMDGYVLSHESAFVTWAKLEVNAGAKFPALLELSTADELDCGFEREMTVDGCFRQFLRQVAIRLPEPIAAYANYMIRIARQIASGEVDAFSGVKTLCETYAATEWRRKVSSIGFMPGFSFDADRFKLLANGIVPGSFEPLGYAPEVADRIRAESAKFVEQNAAIEITSDDPDDWPMIRFR